MSEDNQVHGALNRVLKQAAENPMSVEELQQLSSDIESQVPLSGPSTASKIVPEGDTQRQIMSVLKGTPEQRRASGVGALKGALLGSGTGAAGAALSGGLSSAPKGLFMGIPGAVAGYQQGASNKRKEQLLEALQSLQPR